MFGTDDFPDTYHEPTVNIFTSAPSQNEPKPPADNGSISMILSSLAVALSTVSVYFTYTAKLNYERAAQQYQHQISLLGQANQHAQRFNDPTPDTQMVVDIRK